MIHSFTMVQMASVRSVTVSPQPFSRRRIRLHASLYASEGRVFSVTICTAPRRDVFADLELGAECVRLLHELRHRRGNPIYAYCLMPDHAHLLVGALPESSIPKFIGSWKSLCFRASRRRGAAQSFWQRSFFDHVLREDEDLIRSCRYILENPVRARLVTDASEYPLSGSLDLEL